MQIDRFSCFAGGLVCAAALATAGCAGNGTSPATAGSGWAALGVVSRAPHYALPLGAAPARIRPLNAYVNYHGGPVLVNPKVYLIFWGYEKGGDPDKLQPLLEEYTKVMGGSGHNNIETQYYEISGSKTNYITNQSNQYGGSWNDDAAIPKTPSDPQIAAEALKAVGHFGYDPNGLYVVATAHNHSESGFGSHWCSYHSETPYKSTYLPYSNLPYMPDAGKSCGGKIFKAPSDESATDEGMTIMAGHEYGEAITDSDPFSGWNGVSGEIADYCAWHGIKNDPFGSKKYTMQPMLSDATASCVQSYP